MTTRTPREFWIILNDNNDDVSASALVYYEKPTHGAIHGLSFHVKEVLTPDPLVRALAVAKEALYSIGFGKGDAKEASVYRLRQVSRDALAELERIEKGEAE